MIRILSAIDTSDHAATVMEYTRFIASVLDAKVRGLCVVETKKIEGPLRRDYLSTVGLDAGLDYQKAVTQFLELKSNELLTTFREGCEADGIEFESTVEKGIVSKIVTRLAEESDLVILGRKGEHAEWHAGSLGGSVESVLRHTHKPVLVTPRKFKRIHRCLVAYDGSRYSREALELAARIQHATGLDGVVLNVQPERDEAAEARIRKEVEEILADREGQFDFEVQEGDAGRWIPKRALQAECDLIVMGAYGHSRIREMILGSSTQQVLHNTPELPVLLRR